MTLLRWVLSAVSAVFVVVFVILVAAGIYTSNLLRDDGLLPKHDEDPLDLEVVSVGDGTVTLSATEDADEDGDWTRGALVGLLSEDGYDQVGDIVSMSDSQVVREFISIRGTLEAGEMVRTDSYAFPEDPLVSHGIDYDEVVFSSPVGEFPAWLVPGSSDTWVVFVHGRNAKRGESLRALPVVVDLGYPAMSINYRNDRGLPADPSGFHRYGQTEWEDVEGAVEYAIDHGAEGVVLVGYSMGGAIVTSFLYESDLVDSHVVGAVLDSPMLDFGATVDLGASERGYPQLIAALAKLFASFRFDVDWDALNYVQRSDELRVPVLLFHGNRDTTVPVGTSDALAEARSDLVEYVRYVDTEHVRAWNVDQGRYERALEGFLRRVAP